MYASSVACGGLVEINAAKSFLFMFVLQSRVKGCGIGDSLVIFLLIFSVSMHLFLGNVGKHCDNDA